MKIAIASDHGGIELKRCIREHLATEGHLVEDLGTHTGESVDYPDYAVRVATLVADGSVERGVLVCGTGQGMAITANKVAGIRAGVVSDAFSAKMIMEHNNARIICFGERVIGAGLALTCLDAWLGAEFRGGRHGRRVGKIDALERG